MTELRIEYEEGDRLRDPKRLLRALTLAENMGDVADELVYLCRLFGFPDPEYDDDLGRYVMAWEDRDE